MTAGNSRTAPLWAHNQPSCRNGWQLVCWTGVPVVARTCATKTAEWMWRASSSRFGSAQAGWTLRNRAGWGSPGAYQPTPNPSALTAVAPKADSRLWWMSEFAGRETRFSIGIVEPE